MPFLLVEHLFFSELPILRFTKFYLVVILDNYYIGSIETTIILRALVMADYGGILLEY